jgi:hypothetical protein
MIVLGADTHKRSHTIAAVAAATGELLGEKTVQVGDRGGNRQINAEQLRRDLGDQAGDLGLERGEASAEMWWADSSVIGHSRLWAEASDRRSDHDPPEGPRPSFRDDPPRWDPHRLGSPSPRSLGGIVRRACS